MTLYHASQWQKKFPHLCMVESRRKGGVSPPPFGSLNLGLNTQDESQNVALNRQLFFDALGFPSDRVVGGLQVHQAEVLVSSEGGYFSGYDAFVTNQKDLLLTVGIADCTPILIFDAVGQAVGAVHAGWRGTVAQICVRTLEVMKEHFGTDPKDCYAFIGTCIDTGHFEVGEEVADQFDGSCVFYLEGNEKPHIDLKKANHLQLIQCGIPASQIEVSDFSTVLNNDLYFSYRKENGKTGRMLAAIGMRSA